MLIIFGAYFIMAIHIDRYQEILSVLKPYHATLVAVSKIKPVEDIKALYDLGQRDFGENYVQELVAKQQALPADIRWHFIGHLQRNKVKYIAPFVHLIHGVDSFELLKEIDKQAAKNARTIDCLLQVHIASETTKFGLNAQELEALMKQSSGLTQVQIKGLMGMASFSEDAKQVRQEFKDLKQLFDRSKQACATAEILSMGMSGDYIIALEEGSNMVRIGSLLFGGRV
ncbi:YggS family pyridoxal phosphate-dependent enzyme [Niabella insulamsoli]|uniref:YggS family pyridoxal phosphate-dependent enzyme n=1 Tax=Niabella insulamsoli TaxID=3144874 RepID=UPI0032008D6B